MAVSSLGFVCFLLLCFLFGFALMVRQSCGRNQQPGNTHDPRKTPSLPQKTSTKSAVSNQSTKKGATQEQTTPDNYRSTPGKNRDQTLAPPLAAEAEQELDPPHWPGCNKGLNCPAVCCSWKLGPLTPTGLMNVPCSARSHWRLPPSADSNEHLSLQWSWIPVSLMKNQDFTMQR